MSNKIELNLDASDKATPKLVAAAGAQEKLAKSTTAAAGAARGQAQAEEVATKALGENLKLTVKLTDAQRALAEETKREMAARKQAIGWAAVGNQAENKAFQDALRRRREQAKMREEMGASASAATRFGVAAGAALARVSAVAATVAAPMAALSKEFTMLLDKANRQNKTAKGMRDLVAALPDGPQGEQLLNLVGQTGVRYGVMPDQMAGVAEPLLAKSDANSDGTLDAKEKRKFTTGIAGGGILMGAGVAAEDAGNIILAGDNKGIAGGEAASKLMTAAKISMRNPDVFAKAASPVSQYDEFDTGLAVTAALSEGELNMGLIPQRVADVNLALNSASDTGDFAQEHGLAGLTQAEKIAKLRAAAVESGNVQAFTDQFKNQGLEESKAMSLGLLVQRGDLFDRTMTGLQDTKGAAMDQLTRMRESKLTGPGMAQQASVAALAWGEFTGPGADKARDTFNKELAMGNELQRYGAYRAVDPETGLPKQAALSMEGVANMYDRLTGTAQAGVNGMDIFGRPGAGFGPPAPAPADAVASTQAQLLNALQENNRLLAENNRATQANTGAAAQAGRQAARPVGGNPMNAEEKY